MKLRSLENTCHTWAPWSRQGAIQIHICLYLTFHMRFVWYASQSAYL